MLCRSRRRLAEKWIVILVAGFPATCQTITARDLPNSLADHSTPNAKIGTEGPPRRSLALVDGAVATIESIATRLSFELRENCHVIVRGSIGGLGGLRFLIDTGSIPSMVDRRIAKKLGLEVRQSRIVSFGDQGRMLSAVLPTIRFGPMHSDALNAGVGDLSFLHGVDAIIGLDVLWRNSFRIDYAARELRFGAVTAQEPGVSLEVTPPFLTVQLAIEGRPVRLLVDTGSRRLVLFERRVGDRLPHLRVHGEQVTYHITGTARLRRTYLPHLDIGGSSIENIEALLSDAPVDGYPPEIDGVLGVRTLASKYAVFDFERGRLGYL
jgi:predicted aspartyl protease